jgi:hypothetical protein
MLLIRPIGSYATYDGSAGSAARRRAWLIGLLAVTVPAAIALYRHATRS